MSLLEESLVDWPPEQQALVIEMDKKYDVNGISFYVNLFFC